MSQDPAFLLYSKDWLQGTAQLTPAEKGVFIDLLCHQHQDGSIPSDIKRLARMTGLSESDFLIIWGILKAKFVNHSGDRLVNRKLTKVTTDRSTKAATNRITGTFAAILRLSGLPPEKKDFIKKSFKTAQFDQIPTERLTESITKWLTERLKEPLASRLGPLEDGNANEDVDTGLTRGAENQKISQNGKTAEQFLDHHSQVQKVLAEIVTERTAKRGTKQSGLKNS